MFLIGHKVPGVGNGSMIQTLPWVNLHQGFSLILEGLQEVKRFLATPQWTMQK